MSLRETAELVAHLDGGHSKIVIAFIEPDGGFGGCCLPENKNNDSRSRTCKAVRTTLLKYTYWKYGVIESSEL